MQSEYIQEQFDFRIGLCVTLEQYLSAIGRWQMNIYHLHVTEGLYHAARGQATGASLLQISECHKKAIRKETDKDVGFNAVLMLMVHRTNQQVAFELFKGLFNMRQ